VGRVHVIQGDSSQLKYYPYLLALSNPKKSLGRGRPPPSARPRVAPARRGPIVDIAQQQVKTKPT
jgi:hypothetical protein